MSIKIKWKMDMNKRKNKNRASQKVCKKNGHFDLNPILKF
jgi:hypothetical protein